MIIDENKNCYYRSNNIVVYPTTNRDIEYNPGFINDESMLITARNKLTPGYESYIVGRVVGSNLQGNISSSSPFTAITISGTFVVYGYLINIASTDITDEILSAINTSADGVEYVNVYLKFKLRNLPNTRLAAISLYEAYGYDTQWLGNPQGDSSDTTLIDQIYKGLEIVASTSELTGDAVNKYLLVGVVGCHKNSGNVIFAKDVSGTLSADIVLSAATKLNLSRSAICIEEGSGLLNNGTAVKLRFDKWLIDDFIVDDGGLT